MKHIKGSYFKRMRGMRNNTSPGGGAGSALPGEIYEEEEMMYNNPGSPGNNHMAYDMDGGAPMDIPTLGDDAEYKE